MRLLISTLLVSACWHGVALAQTEQSERISYDADYFTQFAPRTALDMVERVPGFTLSEGEERRGFAGAASNVLIDGAAPAAKSDDIDDVLERIPAADVVRVELIRGEGASASSAQAVRVNIVRRPSSGAGVWEVALAAAEGGRLSPAGQASWSGRRGAVEYAVSAMFEDAHAPIEGEEQSYDAAGALDERDIETIEEEERERRLSGELTTPALGGALGLNLSLSSEEQREPRLVRSLDAGGAVDGSELGYAREQEDIGEIGGTFARVWGAWETEVAALVTRRRIDEDERTDEFEASGAFDEAEQELRRIESGETIVRASGERGFGQGGRIAIGAEAAFNTLEQRLTLTEDDGSGPAPVDVPGANVQIEEERAEVFASLGWRAGAWRLEAGAAVETSRLSQSGDTSSETQLTYWKPSLQASRAIGEDDQLRFRFYRDVGQLDFEDFAASAELSGGDVFAGNANLRPETSWRAEVSGDWRWENGALELTAYYRAIEDALDYVPVGTAPDLFDARGNIGDGELWGLRAAFETAVPLFSHARLRVEGTWQDTAVTDPLTGDTRPQSEVQESLAAVEFRQDLRALGLAWGVDYERERVAPEFRLDRVTNEYDADTLELWLETTRFAGLNLRVYAANLGDAHELRERTHFDPDRTGVFDGRDRRRRDLAPVFGLEVRGAF